MTEIKTAAAHTPGPLFPAFGGTTCAVYTKPLKDATAKDRLFQLPRTPGNVALVLQTVAAPDLLAALLELQAQIRAHHKMDVKKDYPLMVADVAASNAIARATGAA